MHLENIRTEETQLSQEPWQPGMLCNLSPAGHTVVILSFPASLQQNKLLGVDNVE